MMGHPYHTGGQLSLSHLHLKTCSKSFTRLKVLIWIVEISGSLFLNFEKRKHKETLLSLSSYIRYYHAFFCDDDLSGWLSPPLYRSILFFFCMKPPPATKFFKLSLSLSLSESSYNHGQNIWDKLYIPF